MATVTLLREPVSLAADEECFQELISFQGLGDTAAKSLGYRVLQDRLHALEEARKKTLPLKKALADLGIQPFQAASVARYKKRAARRATPAWTNAIVRLRFLVLVLFASAAVGLVAILLLSAAAWLFWSVPDWMILAWNGILFTLWGCCVFVVSTGEVQMQIRSAHWRSVVIAQYPRPIPEFVLQTAVDVKGKCPEAICLIEELRVEDRVLDPFLIVRDPSGAEYFLEVWNEPAFTGKREG